MIVLNIICNRRGSTRRLMGCWRHLQRRTKWTSYSKPAQPSSPSHPARRFWFGTRFDNYFFIADVEHSALQKAVGKGRQRGPQEHRTRISESVQNFLHVTADGFSLTPLLEIVNYFQDDVYLFLIHYLLSHWSDSEPLKFSIPTNYVSSNTSCRKSWRQQQHETTAPFHHHLTSSMFYFTFYLQD